jgi:hypothetical protein
MARTVTLPAVRDFKTRMISRTLPPPPKTPPRFSRVR